MKRSILLRGLSRLALSACVFAACIATAHAYNMTTYHNEPRRTGWNDQETILTAANVASSKFVNLKQIALSNQVDAQPLVISASTLASHGLASKFPNDVVYIATEGNDVLAIDSVTGVTLMKRNLGKPVAMANLPGGCNNNSNVVGITGTPVIDLGALVLYVIAYTWENNAPVYRLRAINLTDFSERQASVVVAATGKLSDGTTAALNAATQRQRPALLLLNGAVYAGFGSFCDLMSTASRGWVLGWRASNLAPLTSSELLDQETAAQAGGGVLPKQFLLSSVWMSGYGLAADWNGYIYVQTGNSNGNRANNLPDSVVKLSPSLNVIDYFTPANFATLDLADMDRGSGGVMVIPAQPGGPLLAVAGGKDGRMFLLNRSGLGGFVAGGPDKPSNVPIGGCLCGPAYFVGSDRKARVVSTGGTQAQTWLVPTTATGALAYEAAGPALPSGQDNGFMTSISSNGQTAGTAVIWSMSRSSGGSLYLQALAPHLANADPSTLTDSAGGVWSFGSQVSSSYGNAVLLNGTQVPGTWGVQLEADSGRRDLEPEWPRQLVQI